MQAFSSRSATDRSGDACLQRPRHRFVYNALPAWPAGCVAGWWGCWLGVDTGAPFFRRVRGPPGLRVGWLPLVSCWTRRGIFVLCGGFSPRPFRVVPPMHPPRIDPGDGHVWRPSPLCVCGWLGGWPCLPLACPALPLPLLGLLACLCAVGAAVAADGIPWVPLCPSGRGGMEGRALASPASSLPPGSLPGMCRLLAPEVYRPLFIRGNVRSSFPSRLSSASA